ncbi:MAG: Clp protease N-terminal domain-containing protein [Solirubrobacteraceae bacterium]
MSLSDRAVRVLVRALALARDGGSSEAGTDHLLLAVLIEDGDTAARMFLCLGVDVAGLREDAIGHVAGDDPRSAARYRELVAKLLAAQATASPHVVDPLADELLDLVDGLLETDRRVLAALGTRYMRSRRDRRWGSMVVCAAGRMAQDWVSRYPLVQGRGTSARLTAGRRRTWSH